MQTRVGEFADFLGDNKWLVGDTLTAADFVFYELMNVLKFWELQLFVQYPNIIDYLKRFEALPKIKEYKSSNRSAVFPYQTTINLQKDLFQVSQDVLFWKMKISVT